MATEKIKLSVRRGTGSLASMAGVAVRVKVDDGPEREVPGPAPGMPPGERFIDIPDRRCEVLISVEEGSTWPATGMFQRDADGDLIRVAGPNFEKVGVVLDGSAGPGRAHMLVAHLFRVRDVTARVLGIVGGSTWEQTTLAPFSFLPAWWSPPASPPSVFDKVSQRLSSDQVVLEVKGVDAPRLFAVSWPSAVTTSSAVPVVLFFHPSVGQQRADGKNPFEGVDYPFGERYLDVLNRYSHYFTENHPITNHMVKGLPAQIAVGAAQGGKREAVLLFPLGKLHGKPGEMGDFLGPPTSTELMSEILQLMGARRGMWAVKPGVGRFALAAFSNGHDYLLSFMDRHAGTDLYKKNLCEVFSFDPLPEAKAPTVRLDDVVQRINRWRAAKKAQPGATPNNEDRVVRIYYQLAGGAAPIDGGSWAAGGGDFTTLASLPAKDWSVLARASKGIVHQIIPATMMTHAMRVSGFK